MEKVIGDIAGKIWSFLDQQKEPVTLSRIKDEIDSSSTLIYMALGWLAREDKIIICMPEEIYSYKISLKR